MIWPSANTQDCLASPKQSTERQPEGLRQVTLVLGTNSDLLAQLWGGRL